MEDDEDVEDFEQLVKNRSEKKSNAVFKS